MTGLGFGPWKFGTWQFGRHTHTVSRKEHDGGLYACPCIHTSDPSFAYICVIVNTENTKVQTTTKVGAKIRFDL